MTRPGQTRCIWFMGLNLHGSDIRENGVRREAGADDSERVFKGRGRDAEDDDSRFREFLFQSVRVKGPVEPCHAEAGEFAFMHEHGAHAPPCRDDSDTALLAESLEGALSISLQRRTPTYARILEMIC